MSNQEFKKGDFAYLVKMSGASHETGNVVVSANPLEIKSFGKTQGTAVRLDLGRNALERIYVGSAVLLRTKEEVIAWAAEHAPKFGETRRAGILRCEESNRNGTLLPRFWAAADARIAKLKSEPVTYEVKFTLAKD